MWGVGLCVMMWVCETESAGDGLNRCLSTGDVDAAHVFDAATFEDGIFAMSFDGESRRLLVVDVGCGAVCYEMGE